MADSSASTAVPASSPSDDKGTPTETRQTPYLDELRQLEHAFPPLRSFLDKLTNVDYGRTLVLDHYASLHPGRCCCLQFASDAVTPISAVDFVDGFASPTALGRYFDDVSTEASRKAGKCRLFILEDLEPVYVDLLGHHLGVDPLVFSEQMNTWNFTDSKSIPHRGLPSECRPQKSFTLRYYEARTLEDRKSMDALTFQMTFAVNRRQYERWRDVDLPLQGKEDKRHALVRRCASFWTSSGSKSTAGEGWDAVLLVDPGMACVKVNQAGNTTYILKDPNKFKNRAELWNAHPWDSAQHVERCLHKSYAYHDGCPTLAEALYANVSTNAQLQMARFQKRRDLASPLDEQVFYWTKVASEDLIKATAGSPANASYYLLKHVAQNWTNLLELLNTTISRGEYLADDYQARIDDRLSRRQWKRDLIQLNQVMKDINYLRRQLNFHWRAMVLNLERLGIQLGCEQVDEKQSLAIKGVQQDLLTIHARMQPLRERAEALKATASDVANLRAAFRGVSDGEFGVRLSLFASIVFPLTLVATIFSMSDDYLPGAKSFWKLWAIGLPFTGAFAFALLVGFPEPVKREIKEKFGRKGPRRGVIDWRSGQV